MTDDERITQLESKAEGLQKQIELMVTVNCELKSHVLTHQQLLGEIAVRLGCSAEWFRSVYVQNQMRCHQQLLEKVEDEFPALAMRMSAYRSLESVPGVDAPDGLFSPSAEVQKP